MTDTPRLVRSEEGQAFDLGIVKMRVIAAGEATKRAFTLIDCVGAEGPWTVMHIHNDFEESFFVLEGSFNFRVGDKGVDAGRGDYVLVPRGTPHTFSAGKGGGRFLVLMVPGGLEEMFIELSKLSPDSITDPKVRAAISAKYDSVPVEG